MEKKKSLSSSEKDALLETLKERFENNMPRHESLEWEKVAVKLEASPEKLLVLFKMEETGGEPDVIEYDKETDEYIFYDCSPESPKGRRSVCYDHKALASRKKHKPENSALNMAAEIGITILSVEQYELLQTFGEFDLKSSSWVNTPAHIRELGGALFCDRRYDTVFTYHNGAESYYAARGFRGTLRV